MATFLWSDIMLGVVASRRLGKSLGINILNTGRKVCTFDCVYCECGLNETLTGKSSKFPTCNEVVEALEQCLMEIAQTRNFPDAITFSGNGEPTLHPEFDKIIEQTILLRNKYSKSSKIAVLTNSTQLTNNSVFNALMSIDCNIMKLDSANPETIKLINCPDANFNFETMTRRLIEMKGKCLIQTLFLRGENNGHVIDNTTPDEVEPWLELVKKINPVEVMIYPIARATPIATLEKVKPSVLDAIARQVTENGLKVRVSY